MTHQIQLPAERVAQLSAWMKEFQGLKRWAADCAKLQRYAQLKDALKGVFERLGYVDQAFVTPEGLHGLLKTSATVVVGVPKETRERLKEAHGAEVKATKEPITADAQVVIKLSEAKRLKIYMPDAADATEVDLAEEFLRDLKSGTLVISDPAAEEVDAALAGAGTK